MHHFFTKMHHFFTRTRLITLAVSSFSLFLFSIVLAFVILPSVIDDQIDKNVRLERGTDQWHRFKEIPFNISFNVTLFAVKNPDDVVNKGAYPILEEKGPYAFDELIVKQDIIINDNNDSVTYSRRTDLVFNQTRSPGVSIDDTITIINPVYVALMQYMQDQPWIINNGASRGFINSCMNTMFNNSPLILKDQPVRNLMLDGVKVCDFSDRICSLVCDTFRISKTIEEVNDETGRYMKFSFFNYKRILPDGVYEVKTGQKDTSEVGVIEQWNFSNMLKVWNEKVQNNTCNEVRGTDGTIFPPHLDDVKSMEIFSTDICRIVPVFYNGSDTYKNIEGNIYRTKPSVYHTSLENPSDDCYCAKKGTRGVDGKRSCFLDGVIDIYPCLGLPVVMSQPHFLNANEKYLEKLVGLNPDPEKHDTYALLDKYTGIPLQAHKRVQLNVILRPVPKFDLSNNLPSTILPLCWLDEGLDLPDDGIDLLNSLLYNTITLVNILKWLLIGISFCLTVFACILLGLHFYST